MQKEYVLAFASVPPQTKYQELITICNIPGFSSADSCGLAKMLKICPCSTY
jgi:hypothetical protein